MCVGFTCDCEAHAGLILAYQQERNEHTCASLVLTVGYVHVHEMEILVIQDRIDETFSGVIHFG